jgi:hypothetical protein
MMINRILCLIACSFLATDALCEDWVYLTIDAQDGVFVVSQGDIRVSGVKTAGYCHGALSLYRNGILS